jgi:hypothetical protein
MVGSGLEIRYRAMDPRVLTFPAHFARIYVEEPA